MTLQATQSYNPNNSEGFRQPPLSNRASARLQSVCKQQKITLLNAPVGYGKTRAMEDASEALSKDGNITMWLTLDIASAKKQLFLKHLLVALGPIIRLNPELIIADAIEQMSSNYFEIGYREAAQHVLFVDNFELVSDAETRDEFLNFCSQTPPNFHCVIATQRVTKKFNTDLLQLGHSRFSASELAFREDETKRVLRTCSTHVPESVIKEVHEITQGWPQGVMLALEELNERAKWPSGHFDGSSKAVRDFFDNRVLSHLSIKMRKFAIVLSVFDRFSESLIYFSFKDEDARSLLSEFLYLNMFIEQDFDVIPWFRLNPLFLDYLRQKIPSVDVWHLHWVCMYASEWFDNNGYVNECAKNQIIAPDKRFFIKLASSLCGYTETDIDSYTDTMLARMNPDDIPSSPFFCIVASTVFATFMRPVDAKRWLDEFNRALLLERNIGLVSEERVHYTNRCIDFKILAICGRGEEALRKYGNFDSSEAFADQSLRGFVTTAEGEAYESINRFSEACDCYLKAQASSVVGNHDNHLAYNRYVYAQLQFYSGNLSQTEKYCYEMIADCPRDFSVYGASHGLLARTLIEQNKLEPVPELITKCTEEMPPFRHVNLLIDSTIAKAEYLAAIQEYNDAYKTAEEAIILGEQSHVAPPRALINAYAVFAEISNRMQDAKELHRITKALSSKLEGDDLYTSSIINLAEGYVDTIEGRLDKALDDFEMAIRASSALGRVHFVAKALAAKVLLLDRVGNSAQAIETLERLLSISREMGFARTILDSGASMRVLLREYSVSRNSDSALRNRAKRLLLNQSRETNSESEPPDNNPYMLTPREVEVLKLLSSGMSRKEISSELFISINTTKKHISNIYSKLGVKNSKEAMSVLPLDL